MVNSLSFCSQDAAWSCWIVVSGFFPSTAAREATLQRFLQFGDVQDHALSAGNWMFIRYVFIIMLYLY